jgi:quercetin dioxygenase-like cupin family protein
MNFKRERLAKGNPIGFRLTAAEPIPLMPFIDLQRWTSREIFPGFTGKVVHSAWMTFVHWEIQPGAVLPDHAHTHEQVVNMIEGEFELTISGQTQRLGPGHVAIIPSNARHSGRAITRCRILDAFYPIREDYREAAGETGAAG